MTERNMKKIEKSLWGLLGVLEDEKLEAYLDSRKIPTIARGITVYPNGDKVKMGDKCTTQQSYEYFLDYARKNVFPAASKLIGTADWNDNEFVVICSFLYNTGAHNVGNEARAALSSGDAEFLASAIKLYVFCDGNVSRGLVNRRKKECHYMQTGEVS